MEYKEYLQKKHKALEEINKICVAKGYREDSVTARISARMGQHAVKQTKIYLANQEKYAEGFKCWIIGLKLMIEKVPFYRNIDKIKES